MIAMRIVALASGFALLAGCAGTTAGSPPRTSRAPSSARTSGSAPTVDPAHVARLQRIMPPLIKGMDHPVPLDQVKVGIMDDPHINAASAGHGEFYVTTGLLQKADDNALAGVLAHELAHQDLNHVAKAQALGAGLSIGMVILNSIAPGTQALTPIAGELVARKYGRTEEYQADRHGVDILRRAGYPGKQIMANTLTWLLNTEGTSGGGFFDTHPATGDRVQAVQRLPGA